MRIYLYTLISPENERTPIRRSSYRLLKNRGRRGHDLLQWWLFGRFNFHFHTYEDHVHTNEGDVGIRLAVREQMEEIFARDQPEFVEVAWEHLNEERVKEINAKGDLLVVAGGYFHHSPDGELKPPVPRDAELFSRIQCPIVVYGAGVNCRKTGLVEAGRRSLTPASERTLRKLTGALSLCAARDSNSAEFLAAYGAHGVEVVMDPAMLLRPAGQTVKVGQGIRIGLNFGLHGPHSEALLKRNLREYIAFAKSLSRRYDCKFYYFVHSEGEELIVRLLRLAGISLEVVRGRAPELLDHYRKMSVQVSHMMHSTILSLSVGTPAISLAYDVKNTAFYELMGLEPYCLDANYVTAVQLEDAACRLIQDRDRISAAILHRRAELAASNLRFLQTAAQCARQYVSTRARSRAVSC